MAIPLTDKVKNLASQNVKTPQLILEIEGIPFIFGAQPVGTLWSFDNGFNFDTEGLFFDQPFADPNSRDFISLEKTTNNLSQQIEPDKGASSSVAVQNVQLVDYEKEVSEIFSFGKYVPDILGRNANYYYAFTQGTHPVDSIPVLRGYIQNYYNQAGSFIVSIAHPENLKRQDIFVPYNGELTNQLLFKDILVQNIFYKQREKSAATLSVEYVSSGVLTVNYDNINNKIVIGVTGSTTADQIVDALNEEENFKVFSLVEPSIVGNGGTVQTPFSPTDFIIDTTLQVNQTTNLLASMDNVTSKIRLSDEIMEVVSFTDNTIEVIRNVEGTPDFHDSGSDIDTVYSIEDDPITMALKLYLSSQDKDPYGEAVISSVNQITAQLNIPNSIFLESQDVVRDFGIVTGDNAVVSGTLSDGTYEILSIVDTDTGQYLVLDGTLITETDLSASLQFISQYNVYPDGLSLTPREVDVQGHIDELEFNPNTFPVMRFDLPDQINGKDFIDSEVFYPTSLYAIPRKARISVKLVKPPLSVEQTVFLNESNCRNLSKTTVGRKVHRYFYNNILFKYEQDIISDKFTRGALFTDEDSFSRIRQKGLKVQYTIESRGLRDNPETDNLIARQVSRIFDRYKFAAQEINNVEVLLSVGLGIEVGDIVSFGSDTMPLTDLNTGERVFRERFCEVKNKSFNTKAGRINLSLLETSFDLNARYGIISFSSLVDSGSSVNRIKIKQSFFTGDFPIESDKYEGYEGQRLRIRSEDYTYDEIVTFSGVDQSNQDFLLLQDNLPSPPLENYIVEQPEYEESSEDIDRIYKDQFVFLNGEQTIASVTSNSVFELVDASNVRAGYLTYIHNDDYSRDSFLDGESKVASVVGNVVTLEEDLTFTPEVGDKFKLIGYGDGGAAYRIF